MWTSNGLVGRWLAVLGIALAGAAISTDCSSPSYKGLEETGDASGQQCTNGVKDGTETDVDCGGNCMTKCADGKQCTMAGDCTSNLCKSGSCAAPDCRDGVKNGLESDQDCGGGTCPKCAVGSSCQKPSDCESLSCSGGYICLPATCSDGIQNQSEKFVDCAGPCALCADASPCTDGADCLSGVCNMTCQTASCTDSAKNGNETGIDCGGGTCPKCVVGGGCTDGARDCQNGVCTGSVCQAAHCNDSIKNGGESDKDCGGPDCAGCPAGSACAGPTDCASQVCTASVCQAPSCSDSVKNGTESAVDCGGGQCSGCPTGGACVNSVDCESQVCTGLVCQAPNCGDGKKNGTETDLDCGGSCVASDNKKCADGSMCLSSGDCASGVCRSGICQLPTCQDVVKNGLSSDMESDIDCGGMVNAMCAGTPGRCSRCDVSRACNCGGDCQSGVCGVMNACPTPPCTCQAPSCPDSVKNQNETDVDCGGSNNCPRCATNLVCAAGTDCTSGVCKATGGPGLTCQAPLCTDGVKNGGETDVDCGGTTCVMAGKKCADGLKCNTGTDCASGICPAGICISSNTCANGMKDANETASDCGGSCGATCVDTRNCCTGADCVSGVCSSAPGCTIASGPYGTCQAATCSDGVKNGTETDKDCGGVKVPDPQCPRCADTKKCVVGADCAGKVCAGGICQAPTCPDGQQNGSETDVDCGGSCSTKCANGLKCNSGADCANSVCGVNNSCPSPPCTCQAPSCSDTVKNQNESDTDCGGVCGSTCAEGRICAVNADCTTRNCASFVCGPFVCNAPAVVYNGHCYQGFGSTRTFADAEAACVIWGGNLVAINDEAERVFIYDNGGLGGGWNWIGLNDIAVEGTYVWTNGDPVTFVYSRSLVNTDAYDCVYQRNGAAQKGDWSAQPCTALHGYVCER